MKKSGRAILLHQGHVSLPGFKASSARDRGRREGLEERGGKQRGVKETLDKRRRYRGFPAWQVYAMGSSGTNLPSVTHLELQDSSLTSLDKPPEESTPGYYLPFCDMLYSSDGGSWAPKSILPNGQREAQKEPEQCPVIDSQGLHHELEYQTSLQLEDHSLEQMQTMVVGEVLKDIETACKLLNISADPMEWSSGNVQKWILWTEHQYRLPQVGRSFQDLTGRDLCALNEDGFRERSPLCGDVLYAHLDIWKSAWMKEKTGPNELRYCGGSGSVGECWPDTEVDSSSSGQPIHLWQFLKELLLKPHSYGSSIRWLNKEKGIFKIEDSAQVARLWGIRKNRPAMNYDKLSRSIRQYYKKGIIRKPDVSQRLVYQFVQPL
ncbi:SAM pointed domain-containing Ets transcription factor isoform X2 [Hyperolius riggenbachi]|uniref:SAM pointed domain-containing Ets transcription factor isoform X2 n=1 Tax=Hyperolius riggenbachi TaxID=752182 RepID=UPI0035A39A49